MLWNRKAQKNLHIDKHTLLKQDQVRLYSEIGIGSNLN